MDIYSHPIFLVQGNAFSGPENPERFSTSRRFVENAERGYSKGDDEDPEMLSKIESMHSYLEELRLVGAGYKAIDHEKETLVDRLSYRTAIAAAMTAIYAAEARGFALVRPPGHHAHRDFTHGYCLLNNMALATKQLIENGERVLVLDLDVHHGCGTEELLESERDVQMISLYKKGLWPKEDHFANADNCLHLALEDSMTDERYLRIFADSALPAINSFDPTVIGISLGLDTFAEEKFGWELTPKVLRTVRQLLRRRQLFGVLEGGYYPGSVSTGLAAFTTDP